MRPRILRIIASIYKMRGVIILGYRAGSPQGFNRRLFVLFGVPGSACRQRGGTEDRVQLLGLRQQMCVPLQSKIPQMGKQ